MVSGEWRDESQVKRDSSLRRPTASQERGGKKKPRLAPFEMTDGGMNGMEEKRGGRYTIKN